MAKGVMYSGRQSSATTGQIKAHQISVGEASVSTGGPVGDVPTTVRIAGVYSNLLIRMPTNAATAATIVGFFVNSVARNQTISVGATLTGEFEDTTNTDAVVSGNILYMQYTNGGGGTNTDTVMGVCFAASVNTSVWMGSFNYTSGGTGLTRFNRFANAATLSATEDANLQLQAAIAGTLKRFCMGVASASVAQTTTWATRIGGVTGNLTILCPASLTGQTEDVMNSDAISVNSLINMRSVVGAGGTGSGGLLACAFETTDGSQMTYVGSTQGALQSYATSVTVFEPLNGLLQGTATEANVNTKCGVACTFSLYEAFIATNGITATSTITFRKNSGGTPGGSISIGSGATGWIQDSTHSDAMVSTDEVDWQIATGGTGTTMTIASVASKMLNTQAIANTTPVFLLAA